MSGTDDDLAAAARARIEAELAAAEQAARGAGENVKRKASAVGAGLRDIPEQALGTFEAAPRMLGGAVSWLGDKLTPDAYVDPQTMKNAGANVEAVAGMPVSELLIKTLVRVGAIDAETAAGLMEQSKSLPGLPAPPSAQEIHQGVSSVLPESVDKFTEGPTDPSGTEEGIRFGTSMLGNLIGGPKPTSFGQAATKFGTRVAAPTAAESAVDPIVQGMIESGKITPETATAIKTLVQFGIGGGGGMIEKSLDQRKAAALVRSNPDALRAVHDGLIADGLDPAQAQARIDELGGSRSQGGNAMIADVGTHGTIEQLGVQAARSGTEGGAELKRNLTERDVGSGERVTAAKTSAFGLPPDKGLLEERFNKRLKTVGAKYDAAKQNQQRPADTQHIADELDSELGVARGGIREQLKKIRSDLSIPDDPDMNLDTSAEGLHAIRQTLDTKMRKMKTSGLEGTPLWAKMTKYRKLIDEELKDSTPDIRRLDERSTAIHKEQTAFETGEQALSKSGKITQPPEFQRVWDSMSPRERQNVVQGASSHISDRIGLTDRERQRLKTELGGDYNEDKMRTIIGDEKTNALMKAMEREDVFKERYNRLVHNSVTADAMNPNLPGSKGILEGTGTAIVTGAAMGQPKMGMLAAGGVAARNALGKMLDRSKADQATKSEIGRLLASDDPSSIFRAMEKLKKADSTLIMPRALQTALTARMAETGHR